MHYKGAMLPVAFSDKGKPDPAAIETLFSIASAAATEATDSPGRILNRWLRSMEVARCAAHAETTLMVAGGTVAAQVFLCAGFVHASVHAGTDVAVQAADVPANSEAT